MDFQTMILVIILASICILCLTAIKLVNMHYARTDLAGNVARFEEDLVELSIKYRNLTRFVDELQSTFSQALEDIQAERHIVESPEMYSIDERILAREEAFDKRISTMKDALYDVPHSVIDNKKSFIEYSE